MPRSLTHQRHQTTRGQSSHQLRTHSSSRPNYTTQNPRDGAGATPPRMLGASRVRAGRSSHSSEGVGSHDLLGSLENDHCGTWISPLFSSNHVHKTCTESLVQLLVVAGPPSLRPSPQRLHCPVTPAGTSASGTAHPSARGNDVSGARFSDSGFTRVGGGAAAELPSSCGETCVPGTPRAPGEVWLVQFTHPLNFLETQGEADAGRDTAFFPGVHQPIDPETERKSSTQTLHCGCPETFFPLLESTNYRQTFTFWGR